MSQPTPQRDQATAQPATAGTPARPPRRPPLTAAERQQRHRMKKKAELEVLKSRLTESQNASLKQENQELQIELKKAQELARETSSRLKEMIESCAREDEIKNGIKDCIKTVLYRASPGMKNMIESSLRERGYIEWFNS